MRTLAELCAQALDRADRACLYEAERRTRREAEQTVARLERLQSVATALAGTLTSEEVADAIITQGVPVLGADFATVAVVAEGGQTLRLLRVTGLDAAEEAHLREIPLDMPGHLPEAVRTGTIVACASAAEAAARYPAVAAERAARGLEAGVALPLRVGARIIGGLTFIFTDERRFTAEDLAFLGALADLCAQALDRARLYEMERQAHTRAAAALRERDAFLSAAAHELKTPLTSLRGFAQLLLGTPGQGGPLDPERTQRALRQIEGQTGKLSLLVDQLLDVARLEAARLALDCREADLAALVAEVAAAAREQTERHTVTVEAPPSAPAWVDPLRLEQVLTNLVGNAIKYSPQGGPIALTVAMDPGGATVQLAVRDRGLGIPEERRAHIFDRFYQAHADHHRSGLGLGLYISHEIVALHGGRLEAEFPADGGARFIVTLPTGRGAGAGDDG
jgi:signal transduction histidine kinase